MESETIKSNWASAIVSSLLNLGIDKFCLAPGGRPTAIIDALDNFDIAPTVHYDERGLGFYALGYAKRNGKPAVVITTSGTAVGNLLPAVMESYHSREPLIILSTDVCWENSQSGSNQSCEQSNIFSNYTTYSFDFPSIDKEFNFAALKSNLKHAVLKSYTGPVHLNFRFKAPFIEDKKDSKKENKEVFEQSIKPECIYPVNFYPNEKEIEEFCSDLHKFKSGVVVIGQLPSWLDKSEVVDFCKHLKWPVFADVLSGLRGEFPSNFPVFLTNEKTREKLKPDCVLFLGGDILLRLPKAPFLRGVHQYFNTDEAKRILISDNPNRQDPFLNYDKRIFSSIGIFCKLVKEKLLATKKSSLCEQLKEVEQEIQEAKESEVKNSSPFSEFTCVQYLAEQITEKRLFVANSLAIRQLDCVLDKNLEIASAHGLKGIDGNLAIASGYGAEVVLIGDTSFLHDLNSLALFRDIKSIIVVLNNNGGHIFNYVESSRTKNFNRNFVNSHSMNFEKSVEQFNLEYRQVQDLESFKQAYEDANLCMKTCVIEVISSQESLHQGLLKYFTSKKLEKKKN